MIGKEDVVSWFKDLESYRRIDIMCTLLNICVPFELRFLGTCLEELGRRDAQELRGIELRVNNPQEFGGDIAACQSGEPTDKKVRRRMALYLALIRACNRTCVNELFKTLDGWGDRDFHAFSDGDPLQELLLVYTMATNHPVFSFEQRLKCGEIFTKIIGSKPSAAQSTYPPSEMSPQSHQQQQSPISASTSMQNMLQQQQQQLQQQSSASPLSHMQSSQSIQTMPMQIISPPMQMTFAQGQIPQYTSSMGMIDTSLGPQMTVDGITQLQLPTNLAIPPDFTTLPPPGTLPWMRPNYAAFPLDSSFPPQSSSPLMSQPSSPSNSRTGSPTRVSSNPSAMHQQQQQQQTGLRNSQPRSIRTSRRPSTETTPPPQHQQQLQQQHQMVGVISGDMILQQQQQNAKFDEMLNVDGAMTQLQQLRNGYTRPVHHTIPRQSNKQSYLHMQHYQHQQQQQQQQMLQQQHQQQQQQQQFNNFSSGGTQGLTYNMQNMNMAELGGVVGGTINSQKSGGSDSGGSSIGSTGEISPPETPVANLATTTSALRARLNLGKLTNRTPNLDSKNITGSSVIYAPPSTSPHQHQQQMQQNEMQQMMTAAVTTNPNYNLTNTIISSSNHMQSPSHVVQAGGVNVSLLTTNQQQMMMNQQHMQQNPQQQFVYHTQLQQQQQQHMQGGSNSNRLTNTMPPPSNYRQHTTVSGAGMTTVAYPQLQPNGEQQLIYSYPPHAHLAAMTTSGGTITFLPSNPPPSIPPSLVRSSPSNTMTVHTPQTQLPAGLMQQSVQPTTAASPLTIVYPMLVAAATTPSNKLSCFNCGSTQHSGANCQEVSMEDATRIVYKLDYNINLTAAQIQQQQQQQQLQQLQQSSNTPPIQAVASSTITVAASITTPTLPPTEPITKTKSFSLKRSGSANKLPPIILPDIVDLTNLSSSNSSSTNSLNGDSHK